MSRGFQAMSKQVFTSPNAASVSGAEIFWKFKRTCSRSVLIAWDNQSGKLKAGRLWAMGD
jgi:hypothetical protein